MDWIFSYQLFLFDLDGLLVNTEKLQYQAYVEMCENHGVEIPWGYEGFCRVAHTSSSGLREALAPLFEEDWGFLYEEKQARYSDLLSKGKIELMEGAEELLLALEKAEIKRCVVTHSRKEFVDLLKKNNSILQTIPYWFTRECYEKPKPDPDGYLKALSVLKEEGDRVIGFEDSYRGYQALKGAGVKPVLICSEDHPQLQYMDRKNLIYFPSLRKVNFLFTS